MTDWSKVMQLLTDHSKGLVEYVGASNEDVETTIYIYNKVADLVIKLADIMEE